MVTANCRRKEVDSLEIARERSVLMLNAVEEMFSRAILGIIKNGKSGDTYLAVSAKDSVVDGAQEDIRRGLVEYLGAHLNADASRCLAMMIVAKDAERSGDYCINLSELAEMSQSPLTKSKYGEQLCEVFADVKKMFAPTRAVLEDSSPAIVRLLKIMASDLRARCGSLIRAIAKDGELNENEAVCLALAFRGCRRIGSHLANTACAAAGLLAGVNEPVMP